MLVSCFSFLDRWLKETYWENKNILSETGTDLVKEDQSSAFSDKMSLKPVIL